MTLLNTLLALGIIILAFSSLTRMSIRTKPAVRWGFSVMLSTATLAVIAPFIGEWGYQPDAVGIITLSATLLLLAVRPYGSKEKP